MIPELIPGSLFAIVLVIIGWQYEEPLVLFTVALALAAAWLSFSGYDWARYFNWLAIALFFTAFVYAFIQVS